MKKVDVIPIFVGALGAVSQRVENCLQRISDIWVEHFQKIMLLGNCLNTQEGA